MMRCLLSLLVLLFLRISHGFFGVSARTCVGLKTARSCTSTLRIHHLFATNGDNMESIRLDESKISDEERERLARIRRLTKEADEFAKDAGFVIEEDDDDFDPDDFGTEIAVKDTDWSGQSDLDAVTLSSNSWGDMASRTGLVFADVAALITFAAIGRSNHGEGIDIAALLGTAAPFVISWLLLSPLLGTYSREATSSKGGIPVKIAPGWLVSVALALAIRGTLKGGVPPTPFIIVSMVSTFGLLSVYRYLYISLVGETSDEEKRSAGALEVFKMVGSLIKRW